MSKTLRLRRKKITERLDRLQQILEQNTHLGPDRPEAVALCSQLSVWFSVMTEEDREYYQCGADHVHNALRWPTDD